jgi:hypothetical protein
MLRIFEAARVQGGEPAVDALYAAWGERCFRTGGTRRDEALLAECVAAAGLDAALVGAADDDKWDGPIVESMQVAYRFGGPKTQTPTIAIYERPPHGFKGPVMTVGPTGDAALRLWDAILTVSREEAFFEITRPRSRPPLI